MYLTKHTLREKGPWLSKVWTFFVLSAVLFSVYPPQTFSLALQYLEKGEYKIFLVHIRFSNAVKVNTQYSKFPYVLFECFCAARCRNSGAPSCFSSSSLSAESSCWQPRCGGEPWPSLPLWLLPSPPHPRVASRPLFSAVLFPMRDYYSC